MHKTTSRALLAALTSLFGAVFLSTGAVQAYTIGSPPLDHQPPGYYNSAEYNAWWGCNYGVGTLYSGRGAIWFTSEQASYYSLGVNVVDGQTSVPVYIRGSVYSCSQNLQDKTIYATSVSPSGAEGWRLTNLSGSVLNRGTFINAGERRWTSQGGSITATLNVSGLAMNNSVSTAVETVNIDLYRCYSTTGISGINCYAEPVPVVVTRTPPPSTYTNSATAKMTINGASTPSPNNTIVRVGDTVTWTYGLTTTQNGGPFSNRTVDYAFVCEIDGMSLRDDPPTSRYMFTSPGTVAINDGNTYRFCRSPFIPARYDIGKTVCHGLEYYPKTQAGEGVFRFSETGYTDLLCVKVGIGTVTPQLTMTPTGSRIPDGSDLRFDFGATNDTNPATRADICYRARIWYEKSPTPNSTYESGTDSLYFQKASTGCGGGADGAATVPENTTVAQLLSDARAVDITKGGKVCADWYIESVTRMVGTGSPNPVWKCITIGKVPSVQVWGNELRTNNDTSEISSLTTTITTSPPPMTPLILSTDTLVRGGSCEAWSAGDANAIFGASGSLAKLKQAYGPPVSVLASSKDSPGLSVRYISPLVFSGSGAIPSYGNYSDNTCLESNGSSYIFDDFNHLQPSKGDLWYSFAETAFRSGDSGSTLRTYTTNPRNELASFRSVYGLAPLPGNIWARFFSNLIAPYDPVYTARSLKSPYTDYFDYQIWAVGGDETRYQDKQIVHLMSDRTAGASVFRQSFDIDYAAVANTDPAQQQTTGLILFTMVADDFAAGYINGHRLTSDVLGMTRGNVVSKGGRFIAVAVDKTWLNAPGPDGVSRGNVLTVIDFDKYQIATPTVSDVGVGVMYSLLYFPPKYPPATSATTGSWVEYGALAPGAIRNTATGSGLVREHSSPNQASWSKLTFSNAASPYGRFASATAMGTIPNIAGYFAGISMPGQKISRTGAVTIGNTSSDKPSDLTQPGGRVLVATGKVTIADNIVYNAAGTVGDMRQVVIIAPDIEIRGNVTQVDAWLIASDSINTCSDVAVAAALSSAICNQPLKVNGALTATSIYLRRTAGNDKTTRLQPAEILNLRGDAYMWARTVSEQNGTWTTRAVIELPPRY